MKKTAFNIKNIQTIDHNHFFWPSSDNEYLKLSKQIRKFLSQSCPEFFLYQFSVVQNQIEKGLFEYISILYDFKKIKKKSNIVIDLKNEYYFKNILLGTPVEFSYNYNLELKRQPKFFFRNYFVKFLWKFSKLDNKIYVVSKNDLYRSFKKLKSDQFFYIPPIYFLGIEKKIKNCSIADSICKSFIELLEKNIFILNDIEKKSISNLISSYLTRFINDLYKIEKFFTKIKNCKSIITGTGDQYFNRLMSYYAKINNICSIRFDHGGERIFFKDDYNLKNELSFVDKYYTFGNSGSRYLRKQVENLKIPKIQIYGISFNHKKIEEKKKINTTENNKQKILFIGQSFVGESRNPFGYKLVDPILYNWHFFLLKKLRQNKVKIILKTHPKGILFGNDKLESLAFGVIRKNMSESIREFDVIICDYVGTAFLEALSNGKKIILLDTLKRNFNKDVYSDFEKNIIIVKCFWHNNLLRVKILDVIHAINKLRNRNFINSIEFYNSIYK